MTKSSFNVIHISTYVFVDVQDKLMEEILSRMVKNKSEELPCNLLYKLRVQIGKAVVSVPVNTGTLMGPELFNTSHRLDSSSQDYGRLAIRPFLVFVRSGTALATGILLRLVLRATRWSLINNSPI